METKITKLTSDDLQVISAFEKFTGSKVEDYISEDDAVYFVVTTDNFRAIIGKNGSNIKLLESRLGKKVKVYKYSKDLKDFIQNLTLQYATHIEADAEKGTVEITVPQDKKALLIGRAGSNINIIKKLLQKHFGIRNVMIK